MPRLFLVRHAHPCTPWGEEPDPGIDAAGVEQSRSTASELAASLAPMAMLSSPLRRCRETAQPLEQMWQQAARVFAPVVEMPAPPLDSAARREWLTRGMQGTWQELQASAPEGSPDYLAWREQLLDSLAAIEDDSVVYTHFWAINAVVARARDSQSVICFRPDHASVTVVDTMNHGFRLVALGRENKSRLPTR